MRDKPLRLGFVNNFERRENFKHIIVGLDLLEPFGYIAWDRYKVYTVPSLVNESVSGGGAFVFKDREGRVIYKNGTDNGESCLGELFGVFTDEEKKEFMNNLKEILECLGES